MCPPAQTASSDPEVDPTTLAVVRGGLEQIAAEMDLALVKSAFSPVITEMEDRGAGLYEPGTGDTIVQGPRSLPVFVSTMQYAVRHLLETLERRQHPRPVSDGDIWAFNDPYYGGTHAQDFKLIRPYFHEGEIFCWIAVTGHWMDMGGAVPGSFVPTARECYAEGLRVPPLQIYEAGIPREDALALILENVRVPEVQSGDLEAMINALRVGTERLDALMGRYGADRMRACIAALRAASRAEMESIVASIPDGAYEFEEHIDGDGIVDEPIRVHVALEIDGGSARLDFSRSSGPSTGPFNLAWNTTVSGALIAIKHLFPEVSINAGCFEPFSFEIPETTFLNAKRPRPVGGYLECIGRVITTVLGAFGQALPHRVPADWFGTSLALTVGGEDWLGDDFVGTFPFAGGMGASAEWDGLVNGASLQGLARYPVIERTEQRWPLLFRRFELRDGSGGDGRRRGGLGNTYEVEAFRKPVSMTVLGDRARFKPFGVAGGGSAAGTEVRFRRGGEHWVPPTLTKAQQIAMEPGDGVVLHSPGGGGHGDPPDREPDRVREDVANGYIDADRAQKTYGVNAASDAPSSGGDDS